MNVPTVFSSLIHQFLAEYDAKGQDQVWKGLSDRFHQFWNGRVLSEDPRPIPDEECDGIIRILDSNAKGNTKYSEAIARAMVSQGAWRRMLNEFHSNQALGKLMDQVLREKDITKKAFLINELYKMNDGKKNNLTGPSGNAVNDFLAAYNPMENLSIISLKDRRAVIEYLGLSVSFDWNDASIGDRIVKTNSDILEGVRGLGLIGSARTISRFFYSLNVKALWRGENTVKRPDKNVNVMVPTVSDEEDETAPDSESIRESMQIQGLLAKIGSMMGFTIWLPKADRSRVLKVWKAEPDELLDELPIGYDSTTTKTIEQIDVLWLRRRSIVRAFEVEHTTSIYSGLLRMADLVALQPNIQIKLHIVAPSEKREKVLQEIQRPVFSLLEGGALSEICTYLSYDSIREIGEERLLAHLKDDVLEAYEEFAE